MTKQYCYNFIGKCDVESWLARLIEPDNWRQGPVAPVSDTFFDTFDRRLYNRGTTLSLNVSDGRRSLRYLTFSGEPLASADAASEPGFVKDLPDGPLRRQLLGPVEMRRLLPLVTVHKRQRVAALLNSERKTVLRLLVSTERVAEYPDRAKHSLPPQLRVLPVRGYHSPLRSMEARLDVDPSLQHERRNLLAEALAPSASAPVVYTSKLDLRLRPEQSAADALGTIFSTLLHIIKANLDGVRADIDTEFLHDFRVAVRRTRSALTQLKCALPPDKQSFFRDGFSRLFGITGPTRDLDVYLLRFDDYRCLLPEDRRDDLDPFRSFLEQLRDREHRDMVEELDSPPFSGLMTEWQAFLERYGESEPVIPAAGLPVREVADKRIRKLFRRCLKQGNSVTPESPAEDLHLLRKTCKKLRYMLEFFQSLHLPEDVSTLIKTLKGLQDNLGDIQDMDVQSDAVNTFGIRMAEQNLAQPATLLAMGMLSESLRKRQLSAREEFHRRFADFSHSDNIRLFEQLFGRPERKGEPEQ